MRQAAVLGLILAVGSGLGGCSWFGGSGDKAAPTVATEASEEAVRKNCADENWKKQNLGLWYSVCRQPMRW